MEDKSREGWRRDKLGVIAPVGGGANWKEFFKMLRRNIIVIVVILYLLFMISFKIWPVW